MKRKMPYEPLPVSVLFALGGGGDHGSTLLVDCCLNAIAVWIKNESSVIAIAIFGMKPRASIVPSAMLKGRIKERCHRLTEFIFWKE